MVQASQADLEGREFTNVRGERLGKIDALLVHGEGETPTWARVKLGRLGRHKVIVPLENAEEVDGKLCLPYETEHVQATPEIELENERLGDEEVDLLCRHYGLERVTAPSGIEDDDIDLPREARDAKPPAMEEGDDSPLVQRRHERAEELGVPASHDEDEAESAEPSDEAKSEADPDEGGKPEADPDEGAKSEAEPGETPESER